jgi:hypothetical protein
MEDLAVGQRVTLKVPMMQEKIGSVGYVYETYRNFDGNGLGASIIFSNGSYDGFSKAEQESFLEIGRVDQRYTMYGFKNVNLLVKDYRHGYWQF